MTPHQILIVAIRLVAIVWFFHAVGHTASILMFVPSAGVDESNIPWAWGLAAVELIACVFLWLAPATIARRLLPSGQEPITAPTPALLDWQTMAVIAIGIWVLAEVIPDVAYWGTLFGLTYSDGRFFDHLDVWSKAGMVALAAKIVVGFWLLFGAKGFAAFLFRVRTAGIRP